MTPAAASTDAAGHPAQGHVDDRRSPRPAIGRVYSLSVAVALLAFGLSWAHAGSVPPAGGPSLPWWPFVIAFAFTEAFLVHFEHRREAVSFSLSTIPLVVGLFTVAPVPLIGARLAGSAAALVLHRRQTPFKLTLNLSGFWLETAVAVATFHALSAGPASRPSSWAAAFVAALAGDVTQTVVVGTAISLYQRRWEAGLFSAQVVTTLCALVDTCLGIVVVLLASEEPAALALLAVVFAMLLVSYRVYSSLREKHRNLEQLYDFTGQMSDALLADRLPAALLEETRELMHAEHAWLYLPSRRGGLERIVLSNPESEHGIDVEPVAAGDPHELLHDRVHAEGRAILITGTAASGLGVREAIAAPVHARGSHAGTLVVAERSGEARLFSPEDVRLLATVANHAAVALENGRLVDRLRDHAAASEHQSLHDALTGLPNRILFARRLDESLQGKAPVAVLLLDLDRFKEVNDTLGHDNGDTLLLEVGRRLRTALRQGDTIARLGGDEFGVLLPDVAGAEAAVQVAHGIIAVLERPIAVADVSVGVGLSIGVAVSPEHGTEGNALLQRADVAMYTAKTDQSGVELYRLERDGYSRERLALGGELQQVVDAGGLDVHYQPQIDLATGQVVGAEALVRWPHPTRGFVPPDEFVPIAEQTGLIRPLTRFVLEQALRQCAEWRDRGWDLRMSVNLSTRSLLQQTLADDVAELLGWAELPPSALCLELTETSIMVDPKRTFAMLERLSSMGVTLAVDDFGTGHSSLAYLKRLPVGEIKVDKSFVFTMAQDPSDDAIVCSIVDLARNLGLPVVAEGVEDEASRDRLVEIGCTLAQGYLFSRPQPADAVNEWLEAADVRKSWRSTMPRARIRPNRATTA